MEKIKVLLMSGSDTGCTYAQFFLEKPQIDLVKVVTGLDSVRGRGKNIKRAIVANFCDSAQMDVYQPEDVNSPQSLKTIKESGAQMALVVDYGQILSGELLSSFPLGAFNIHYSLLPDLRGASPVRGALMKGYSRTGVTLMEMNEKIDEGGIIAQEKVNISSTDNYATLKDKLTKAGIGLLDRFLDDILSGKNIKAVPQQEDEESSYISKIDKSVCAINWNLSAVEILNRIRAMAPSPGCFSYFKTSAGRIKILGGEVYDRPPGKPGEIVEVTKKYFAVSAGDKCIKVTRIQAAGKRAMDTSAYLAGNDISSEVE